MTLKTKNKNISSIEAERFLISSYDNKIKFIQEKINEIKVFYENIQEINDEDIIQILEPITNSIYKRDILNKFKIGIIFLDEFKSFIMDEQIEIEENTINNIFAYFDKKNKNYFIFVRDIINYFKGNEKDINIKEESSTNNANVSEPNNLETKSIIKKKTKNLEENKKEIMNLKLSKDKYVLILMEIFKKLIKFCLVNMNIEINEFSDKFLFVKESLILNY